MMKSLKTIFKKQVLPTLATAGVAALLAFCQSLAAQHGLQCVPSADPTAAGGLGAALRVGLEVLKYRTIV